MEREIRFRTCKRCGSLLGDGIRDEDHNKDECIEMLKLSYGECRSELVEARAQVARLERGLREARELLDGLGPERNVLKLTAQENTELRTRAEAAEAELETYTKAAEGTIKTLQQAQEAAEAKCERVRPLEGALRDCMIALDDAAAGWPRPNKYDKVLDRCRAALAEDGGDSA